jgi:hypothetical protein
MGDFRDRLKKARNQADKDQELRREQNSDDTRRKRETSQRVGAAADDVESHIELCLKDFQNEFMEFRYESHVRDGRNLRVYWDEPHTVAGGKQDNLFHQLSFQVRSYDEYADVEVIAKSIVRNRDRRRCRHEEDVWEGDPKRLLPFVEREILEFTKLYTATDD